MELHEQADAVNSREDLVAFIETLAKDFVTTPGEWENLTLGDFLGAMGSWVEDMDGWWKNTGREPEISPSWRTFAQILCAARIYE